MIGASVAETAERSHAASARGETLRERLIAAFVDGAEAEMLELRGYALTAGERAETLAAAERHADGVA